MTGYISPLSAAVSRDKDQWVAIGRQILAHFGCGSTVSELGRCIDSWKQDRCVPEEEMIDGLGFALGELLIAEHGGRWVFVTDSFGQTPAIQRVAEGSVTYVLDAVSKRLRDDSRAEAELQTLADVYGRTA